MRRLPDALPAELKITQNIIPPGKCGRPLHRPMRPTFIMIHSTDKTPRSADALNHALAMNKGLRGRHNRTGFLTGISLWTIIPFTKAPTNETGEHADYEGQGNRSSIGIEMCVNRGNNLGSTIDRTAQLTARLKRQYRYSSQSCCPAHALAHEPVTVTAAIWGSNDARESCSMAVVLVQNGVHSWPKSHFMHDEVGNDVSSGPSFGHDDPVFAQVNFAHNERCGNVSAQLQPPPRFGQPRVVLACKNRPRRAGNGLKGCRFLNAE